ncbi:DUF4178 domain-containing protein [Synechococcus sp. MIT S1220]|uniref:DUF4178 domain-containing protein n=1 Tax=Synechococcus sp. MIT S1220 TaxID=3082549 RepID=UPI0039B07013
MTALIIVLLIIALVIWVVGLENQKRRQKPKPDLTPKTRNLFNLEIGDIVQYGFKDWVVESIFLYEQGDYEWREYLLRDSADVAWLCVEEDDWLEISWMVPVPKEDVALSFPLRDSLKFNDLRYRLDEKGSARYQTIGRSNNQKGSSQFYDYKADNGSLLSIESYGISLDQGDIELCLGEVIRAADLTLLPGDGKSVYSS